MYKNNLSFMEKFKLSDINEAGWPNNKISS